MEEQVIFTGLIGEVALSSDMMASMEELSLEIMMEDRSNMKTSVLFMTLKAVISVSCINLVFWMKLLILTLLPFKMSLMLGFVEVTMIDKIAEFVSCISCGRGTAGDATESELSL